MMSLFPLGAQPQPGGTFGMGIGPIHFGSVQCDGTEANLVECPSESAALCTHADDAGVTCRTSMLPQLCDL